MHDSVSTVCEGSVCLDHPEHVNIKATNEHLGPTLENFGDFWLMPVTVI